MKITVEMLEKSGNITDEHISEFVYDFPRGWNITEKSTGADVELLEWFSYCFFPQKAEKAYEKESVALEDAYFKAYDSAEKEFNRAVDKARRICDEKQFKAEKDFQKACKSSFLKHFAIK